MREFKTTTLWYRENPIEQHLTYLEGLDKAPLIEYWIKSGLVDEYGEDDYYACATLEDAKRLLDDLIDGDDLGEMSYEEWEDDLDYNFDSEDGC